jgi:hypothetical protein
MATRKALVLQHVLSQKITTKIAEPCCPKTKALAFCFLMLAFRSLVGIFPATKEKCRDSCCSFVQCSRLDKTAVIFHFKRARSILLVSLGNYEI